LCGEEHGADEGAGVTARVPQALDGGADAATTVVVLPAGADSGGDERQRMILEAQTRGSGRELELQWRDRPAARRIKKTGGVGAAERETGIRKLF
jgi:hypothetical protein